MPRLTLAIETSNPSSGARGPHPTLLVTGPGVAIGETSGPTIAAEPLDETARRDDLITAIDRLFRRAGATPKDLSRIALSIGPGGYTGLRIAVATTKMLAEVTGCEIIPIPSALCAAYAPALPAPPALVCLASKADIAHATLLPDAERSRWHKSMTTPGLIRAADLPRLVPGCLIADRHLPPTMAAEAARLNIPILEPLFSPTSLLALAPLFHAIDPLALTPLYPREPEAVTLWRGRHQRAK